MGDEDPYLPESGDPGFSYPHLGDMSDPGGGCTLDDQPRPCTVKTQLSWFPSWSIDRWRRMIDLRRTPSTFPTTQGYGGTDTNRQKYGMIERDDTTGLDHTPWRKYENTAGRWTSPDPYRGSMTIANPQSFNRYAYVQNDPVNFIDPSGLDGPSAIGLPLPFLYGPGKYTVTIPISFGSPGDSGGYEVGGDDMGVLEFKPIDVGVLLALPQNPAPGSFRACVGSLEGTGFSQEAADLINTISGAEGTSRDLLAVTWMNENAFRVRPAPNTNGYDGDYKTGGYLHWDVGPFHINIGYTFGALADKSVNFKGLTVQGVFGYTFYDVGGKTPTNTFDGVPSENGRMAARRLNAAGSNDRQRAVNYAGQKNGPARGRSYDTWHNAFANFFKCYRGY